MDSDEVTEVLANQTHDLAQTLRITGTPTFVLQDEMLRGYLPADQLEMIVAEKRAARLRPAFPDVSEDRRVAPAARLLFCTKKPAVFPHLARPCALPPTLVIPAQAGTSRTPVAGKKRSPPSRG